MVAIVLSVTGFVKSTVYQQIRAIYAYYFRIVEDSEIGTDLCYYVSFRFHKHELKTLLFIKSCYKVQWAIREIRFFILTDKIFFGITSERTIMKHKSNIIYENSMYRNRRHLRKNEK